MEVGNSFETLVTVYRLHAALCSRRLETSGVGCKFALINCSHVSNCFCNCTHYFAINNTVYLQMNGAVSRVNKKFISHLTRAKPTPSAAATVQVFHALPAVRFSCLLRGRMHGASFLNPARNSRCSVITDLDTSKRSTQKAFSCCDAIL